MGGDGNRLEILIRHLKNMDDDEPFKPLPLPGEVATEADETLAAILGLPAPKDTSPIDWDERSRAFMADAKKRDAIARYRNDCEKGYPESNWDHPSLAPYRHAIEAVRNWQFGPRGIIATGKTGRGKTRSIFDLYRRLACDEGRTVRYYFAGDWFSELGQQVHYGRDEARSWIELCALYPVVILDDLGQEALSVAREDWAKAWLFRFLDLRIARKLPLIVSTNQTAKQIAGVKEGESIRAEPLLRRLFELGEVVKFEELPANKAP